MDALIYFVGKTSHPGMYLPTELDAIEVTWDDVEHGHPFYIEGAESVIIGIVNNAIAADDLEKVVYL